MCSFFGGEARERQVKRNAVIVSADKSQTAAFCLLSEEFQWIDALDLEGEKKCLDAIFD